MPNCNRQHEDGRGRGYRKKLIGWAEWQVEYASECPACREMWKERNKRGIPGEPDCASCRVDALPENVDASKIFNIVRYQLIMGPSGAIDLNHLAIHKAMDVEDVKDKKKCFDKVRQLGAWWVSRLNKKD